MTYMDSGPFVSPDKFAPRAGYFASLIPLATESLSTICLLPLRVCLLPCLLRPCFAVPFLRLALSPRTHILYPALM